MDTKQLLTEVKARFNHNSAKAYLKDKYESKLCIADQGGLWKITPELIATVSAFNSDKLILTDMYGNPVKVNRQEMLTKLTKTYSDVMEQWYNEWSVLENAR
jgi:hypothetical protein